MLRYQFDKNFSNMPPVKKRNMQKYVTNIDVLCRFAFKLYGEGELPMEKKFALHLRDKEMIAVVCHQYTKFWKAKQ